MNDLEHNFRLAKEALEGKRNDVYPCREDIPAELWGMPIPKPKEIKDVSDCIAATINKVSKL